MAEMEKYIMEFVRKFFYFYSTYGIINRNL